MPPPWLEWILWRLVGRSGHGATIVGDLREEYARERERRSALATVVWYGVQVVRTGCRVAWTRARRVGRVWTTGSLGTDLAHGVRGLARAPFFTVVVTLTLGLGVGAAASLFSVVNGVLLSPLPFGAPDELIDIANNTGGPGWYGSSPAQYFDYASELETVEALGGWLTSRQTIGDTLQPRRVDVAFVTHSTWETLDVAPLMGRVFDRAEDEPNATGGVVLSEEYWRAEFGADPGILGQEVRLGSASRPIVGVMPASFDFPDARTTMWLPFQLDPNDATRSNHFVNIVGRLAPGAGVEAARAEVSALAQRAIEAYPQNYSERGYRARVLPLRESFVSDVSPAIWAGFAAVVLVLLIASVNVANLVIARGESRMRDVAMRRALGGGRARVARGLLVENALIAALGGGVGLALAWLGVRGLVAFAPQTTPRLANVALNGEVMAFALATVAGTGLVFGLLPALRVARTDLRWALGRRGRVASTSSRLRRVLVVGQVAMATALALGAGLMVRSMDRLHGEDLGFRPDGVATASVVTSGTGFDDGAARIAFYDRVVGALEAGGGVARAAVAARLPLVDRYSQLSIHIDGTPVVEIGAADDAFIQVSTPGYFDVMGIAPSEGRLFTEVDREDTRLVAVVNETMARTLFPDGRGLGGRVRMFDAGYPYVEVVGVIPDVKESEITGDRVPRLYLPMAQTTRSTYQVPGSAWIVTRGETIPATEMLPTIRAAVSAMNPAVPVSQFRTMEGRVADSLAIERFATSLLQVFGVVALVLALVGVYGVLSLAVLARTSEIGVRKAFGAPSRDILVGVLSDTLAMVVVGGLVGLGLGVAGGRLMGALVYGVEPWDPFTSATVLGTVLLTSALAALLPALRASRVDPMVALES